MNLLIQNKLLIYLIPFIIGIITSFSLPPYNLFYINFITFPLIFFYLTYDKKKTKWSYFKIGWMFGFGYFIFSLYWITISLTYEDTFKPFIPFALIFIPLFLGLFYGFITFFSYFFRFKKNFKSILIFSILFSLVEYFRSFIFGGFPWNLISYSFTNYIEFIQILQFTGTYALNLLIITLFLIPATFFFNYRRKKKLFIFVFITLICFGNFFYGKTTIEKNKKVKATFLDYNIKIVSPKININRFFQNEEPEDTILDLIEISKPNKLENTIFIYPEGVLSNIYLQDIKNYKYIFSNHFSDKHKLILGINSDENQKIFNSLVVLDNELNIISKYNKNKLVPFGEFLPFENLLSKFGLKKITQGYRSFSSDNKRKIINLNDISFLPLICYEIIYSGKLINNKKYFDFILNISEDGWFGDSAGPHQHFSHSIFRSIEEGKNLIRSANNGISAFINSKGQIIKKIESTDKGVFSINSFKKGKKTIFNSYGNKIFFYFIIFYISLIFFLKKRENKS